MLLRPQALFYINVLAGKKNFFFLSGNFHAYAWYFLITDELHLCIQICSKRYQSYTWRALEFLAAMYLSLPPGERDLFVRPSFGEGSMRMVMRFMAGMTKFQSQEGMESILALEKKGGKSLLESCHWLFEAHDPGLVQKCMGHQEWKLGLVSVTTLDPSDCYVVGYCISNSRQPWDLDLRLCSITGECVKRLTGLRREEPLTTSGVLTSMAIRCWGTKELLF